MAPSSDAGLLMSDAPSRSAATPKRSFMPSSSAGGRPRVPPSESMGGAPSDDEAEGFADDQVPRGSRIPDAANIPRVEDRIGLMVQDHFEAFIEGYVALLCLLGSQALQRI